MVVVEAVAAEVWAVVVEEEEVWAVALAVEQVQGQEALQADQVLAVLLT
jgi:hypothetical protein